ncbi:unnamed protein product [Parascedosporium putredinis]|uniref:Uncharacterized protein n=1 Tax=Parascedosporium putredinis TaxID=1442378 RepID=A0A9P1H643_9PEZI|nr:unnamed protein product [Parascedosporium putredinis]CAI7998351.1 unnamed protein product [Parascedosporium putredinis]
MQDLALASLIDGVPRKQAKPMLLKTRFIGCKLCRVGRGKALNDVTQIKIDVIRSSLVQVVLEIMMNQKNEGHGADTNLGVQRLRKVNGEDRDKSYAQDDGAI